MSTGTKAVAALCVCLSMAGCAGREAHPVAVVQPQDASASCPAIAAEIAANQNQARSLSNQAETHNATNVAVGVIGAVLFWPALFALDLSDYEKQEITALRERDNYLQNLANQHGCNGTQATSTPPASSTKTVATLPTCSPWNTNPAAGSCMPRPSQMPND